MLGYGQHELLELLDWGNRKLSADKAAHVEFGDGDRQPFPGFKTRSSLIIGSQKQKRRPRFDSPLPLKSGKFTLALQV
jgi:hypothetical protein